MNGIGDGGELVQTRRLTHFSPPPISIYILNPYKFIGADEMILEEETFEKFGYYPSDVSGQPILVACDECGAIRTIIKRYNHRLCRICSQIKYSQLKDNYGKKMSEEQREKISANHADISGESHPNWKGGISFEPYCTKFNNALKEEIRDKFGRKCFLCPKTEEEEGRKLSVHHVDYNKEQGCNSVRWLLVPLCRSCNTKVNNNREYWQDFITEKLRQEGYL